MARKAAASASYIPALTGLRFFAALMVFIHHYAKSHNYQVPFGEALKEGYIGVSIFFTLSGYLITRTYFDALTKDGLSFRTYWVRRFARIFPVYWVILILNWCVSDKIPGAFEVFANVTLLKGLFDSTIWTGLGPSWSLTVEECFYLLAPLIFFVIAGFGRRNLGVALGILLAAGAVLYSVGNALEGTLLSSWNLRIYGISHRFGEFAVGILGALWLRGQRPSKPSPRLMDALFVASLISLVGLLELLTRFRIAYSAPFACMTPFGSVPLLVVSVATLALIFSATQQSRLCGQLFGNRLMEYLGKVSFVFYLVPEFMAKVMNDSLGFVPLLLTTLTLSIILYESIERPAHRWILARASSKKPVPARKTPVPAHAKP